MLSIIVPAYNEEENIEKTASAISGIMEENDIPYELLFVDDGSGDRTFELIEGLSEENPSIRGLSFSRNFGKEGAIFAGLRHCRGDCAAVIDCDLQHPPELMVKMYELWRQGYKVVEAVKSSRGKESFLYKFFAKCFYGLMEGSSGIKIKGASDYKLMDRQVIDALNELPERITFYRALSSWVGFKTAGLEFDVAPRNAGTTKWSFKKLFKFALANLTSFTSAPLHIVTAAGILSLIAALVLGVIQIVRACAGTPQNGILPVLLLTGGVIMLALGIIGYYISKIYEEIKDRPRYIVAHDTLNKREKTDKTKGAH